jgi:hypothetical protein
LAVLILTVAAVGFGWQADYDKAHEKQPNQTAEQEREESDREIARYTFWLALGTSVLAFSTVGLWIETRRSGVRQSRDTRRSLAIAKQSNSLSRELFVADQRPWVSVDLKPDPRGRLMVDPSGNITADITISYKNHGRTPATNILIGYVSVVSDPDAVKRTQEKILVDIIAFKNRGGAGITLFPDDEIESNGSATGKVSARAFQTRLRSTAYNPAELLLVGCLRYEAPSNQVGVTGFCFRIALKTKSGVVANLRRIGPSNSGAALDFAKYNVGNSAT